MQSCEELWQWIESFISKAERVGERVELRAQQFRKLCVELGSPQDQFLSVHVAGSKGKGQTASYIAHGLAACGYRVGLYSSPHIHSYSERIQVLEQKQKQAQGSRSEQNISKQAYHRAGFIFDSVCPPNMQHLNIGNKDISEVLLREGNLLRERLQAYHWRTDWPHSAQGKQTQKVSPEIASEIIQKITQEIAQEQYFQPNFFSVLTLLAYFSFSALGCDWVVLETGIGGRLCPTNAVIPELSVITPIELEHTDLLGNNLQRIAEEKAGIIKKIKPCVSSAQDPKVRSVLKNICEERKSELLFSDEAVKTSLQSLQSLQSLPQAQGSHFAERLLQAFQVEQKLLYHLQDSEYLLQLRAASGTQRENLGLALLALHSLAAKTALSVPRATQGLECSRPLGRFAAFWQAEKRSLLLFDGAHTPNSCRRLLCDIKQYINIADSEAANDRTGKRKICLLFGAVQGKNFNEMASVLVGNSSFAEPSTEGTSKSIFDEVLLTRAGTFKENNLPALSEAFHRAARSQKHSSASRVRILPEIAEPEQALCHLLERDADLIVVCGSFYLLGELLPQRV